MTQNTAHWITQCLEESQLLPEPEGTSSEELRAAFAHELEQGARPSDPGWRPFHRALSAWLEAKDVYLVLRIYPDLDTFRLEVVDEIASRGEAALEGLERELLSLPAEWGDRASVSTVGGNTREHFDMYSNLCLSVMEACRRLERAPSEHVTPLLEEYVSSFRLNTWQTLENELYFLGRVREMSMVLGTERVAALTAPGDGPVNWDTIGFVPDTERAQRVVEELLDPGFWTYKGWHDIEHTSEGRGSNHIARTFTMLGEHAIPALEPHVGKGKAIPRAGLICALGFTGSDQAIDLMMRGMSDSSLRVRAATSELLLRFDHARVREALQPLSGPRGSQKVITDVWELLCRLD